MNEARIISLRMERQCFITKADEAEYIKLYRDTQPGQNVYWNGFGQPPVLVFRADFNDMEHNRLRQKERRLVKGRFGGGNVGWIVPEDMELFSALYRKPLKDPTAVQLRVLELIERSGPFTIQQIKEEMGLLVKEITPVLHRLQEAFLIYEDQYDGEWDRGWYRFGEMFPNVNVMRYTRHDALKIVLQRFSYRLVWFDMAMAKSFYKIPEKEIKLAVNELVDDGIMAAIGDGFILKSDVAILDQYEPKPMHFAYAIHRNDFLYKTHEHCLKAQIKPMMATLQYDNKPLQYLLIDGEFHGAVVGHFHNGPYDLNDVVCDLPDAEERKDEIIRAVKAANCGKSPERFLGKKI